MTADSGRRTAARGPRQELAVVLLLGVAGAGLVWLAIRQGWAVVETAAPKPLPPAVVSESGQALVPAAGALALAALAGLAAVLATRGVARRVAGAVLAAFGAGIVAAVGIGFSAADVLAAVAAGDGSRAAADGALAGSTAGGGSAGAAATPLSGLPARVVPASFPWPAVAIAGGVVIVAAGVLAAWRAARLPVMSARFDRAPRAGRRSGGAPDSPGGAPEQPDSASMWEALSRGEDPTLRDPTRRRDPARLD